jgi:hypothetical protein
MKEDSQSAKGKSDWVILTRNAAFLANPEVRPRLTPLADGPPPLLWSDDFASLWQVLKR